jgi:hypothetical protein
MRAGCDALRYEDLGLNATVWTHSFPKVILKRRFDCKKLCAADDKKHCGVSDIPQEIEEELKNHVSEPEGRMFGIVFRA